TEAEADVACDISRARVGVEVLRAGETNRIENARAHELEDRDPRPLLDGHTGEGVVGVAVLPARARLEVERLLGPRVGDGLRRRRLEHSRHHVILRPEVLVSGGVAEEHADGYVVS